MMIGKKKLLFIIFTISNVSLVATKKTPAKTKPFVANPAAKNMYQTVQATTQQSAQQIYQNIHTQIAGGWIKNPQGYTVWQPGIEQQLQQALNCQTQQYCEQAAVAEPDPTCSPFAPYNQTCCGTGGGYQGYYCAFCQEKEKLLRGELDYEVFLPQFELGQETLTNIVQKDCTNQFKQYFAACMRQHFNGAVQNCIKQGKGGSQQELMGCILPILKNQCYEQATQENQAQYDHCGCTLAKKTGFYAFLQKTILPQLRLLAQDQIQYMNFLYRYGHLKEQPQVSQKSLACSLPACLTAINKACANCVQEGNCDTCGNVNLFPDECGPNFDALIYPSVDNWQQVQPEMSTLTTQLKQNLTQFEKECPPPPTIETLVQWFQNLDVGGVLLTMTLATEFFPLGFLLAIIIHLMELNLIPPLEEVQI